MKRIYPFLLSFAVIFTCSCASNNTSRHGLVELENGRPKPPRMVSRIMLGTTPTGTFRTQKRPDSLIVMDSGADYRNQTSLTYLIEMLEEYSPSGKGDLPVHYFIDRDGVVYSGRLPHIPAELYPTDAFLHRLEEMPALETALLARLKRRGKEPLDLGNAIVIMVLGDYDQVLVTEEQEQPLMQLMAYLVHEHNISLNNIYTLNEVVEDTDNPGFYLNNYFIQSTLAKNIPQPPGQHRFLTPPSSNP